MADNTQDQKENEQNIQNGQDFSLEDEQGIAGGEAEYDQSDIDLLDLDQEDITGTDENQI